MLEFCLKGNSFICSSIITFNVMGAPGFFANMKLNLTQTSDYEFKDGLDYEDFTRVSMAVDD